MERVCLLLLLLVGSSKASSLRPVWGGCCVRGAIYSILFPSQSKGMHSSICVLHLTWKYRPFRIGLARIDRCQYTLIIYKLFRAYIRVKVSALDDLHNIIVLDTLLYVWATSSANILVYWMKKKKMYYTFLVEKNKRTILDIFYKVSIEWPVKFKCLPLCIYYQFYGVWNLFYARLSSSWKWARSRGTRVATYNARFAVFLLFFLQSTFLAWDSEEMCAFFFFYSKKWALSFAKEKLM